MYLDKKVTILVPSAGSGIRMGGQVRKQYLQLRDKEILKWTLENFYKLSFWDELFVIVPYEDVEIVKQKVDIWFYDEFRKISVIAGGDTRQKSVFNGLSATPKDTEFVVVHDGVRPFLPVKKTLNALDTLNETDELYGIIAAVKITDTIKSVSEKKIIESTIDRDKIWAVQTPQIFKFQTLLEAHQVASEQNLTVTDDAALLEYMDKKVGIFESDRNNIKITEPYDLLMAELVLNQYIGNEEVKR